MSDIDEPFESVLDENGKREENGNNSDYSSDSEVEQVTRLYQLPEPKGLFKIIFKKGISRTK